MEVIELIRRTSRISTKSRSFKDYMGTSSHGRVQSVGLKVGMPDNFRRNFPVSNLNETCEVIYEYKKKYRL
jgi:hypothetical protein